MKSAKGFTLIEMMIVVVIIAILAAIAYPAYQDYVRKARRADAMDALLVVQNLQEKYRANNTTYGTLAQIGFTGTASVEGRYTIAVTGNTAVAYTVTATGVGDQANDSVGATSCSPLTITVSADNPRGVKTPPACW
ncbi:MAG: type IV pilin protein [Porticoccaceae bacterium]